METDKPTKDEQKTAFSESDWENRILCSDGNCIGVIGPDGNCKDCGKNYEGSLPEALASAEENQPDEPDVATEEAAPAQSAEDATSEEDAGADNWVSRQLCSDGNCIGVIGPDGRCKECGKGLE